MKLATIGLLQMMAKKIELTNREHELLIALSSKTLVTYEELSRQIYNCRKDSYIRQSFHTIQCRLKKKEIDIKTINNRGLILKTKILFR